MAKRTLVLSMILIIVGLALIIYHDPQFSQVVTPASSSSSNPSLRFVSGTQGASGQTIVPYSAVDIIESLLGAALIGFGLVFTGMEIFSTASPSKQIENV
jgi:hypothetical protein